MRNEFSRHQRQDRAGATDLDCLPMSSQGLDRVEFLQPTQLDSTGIIDVDPIAELSRDLA